MRRPYTQLYIHLVFSTWDRLPLITPEIKSRIYPHILSKLQTLNCEPIIIGGVSDHVHLLIRINTNITIGNLVKEIKGSSSHLVTHVITPGEFFMWQGGYGAFTVSKNNLKKVAGYIKNQKEHHRNNDLWVEMETSFIDV